tara:strand:- start:1023 stop:1799 length:777 start_codon:yes stop_codon:yes gene_type:complete
LSHISYSAFKIWNECPHKHKLTYIDRIQGFEGNEYTAFGSAIHSVCENALINENLDEKAHFQEQFLQELKSLPEEVRENLNKSLVNDMRAQGDVLAPLAIPFLKQFFGDFEVVSVEEQLFETIDNDFDFKGFIDLVVKTPDGKYHILDWKTCSWGWKPKRKSDAMTTYQLTFYKNYFAQKHNIDPKNIETYFALLKRTAKKDNVEIFRVTSGPKKTENALNLLNKALHNIKKDFHPKNRSACQTPFGMCEFYNTEHCA